MTDFFAQRGFAVRFGWGPVEAAELASPGGCLVVVDVLSFTTAVSVVVEGGGLVLPYRWRDESARAHADEHGAKLAVGRRQATEESPWTLSPAALRAAPAPGRLVLPSPNGSTIAAAAGEGTVVAACLRNARAVAGWIGARGYGTAERPVVVIASGERWPDGSLRPCLEDQLGAGAVLAALATGEGFSPEAEAAARTYEVTADVAGAIRRCGGGVELGSQGFGGDVDIAVEADSSAVVPVLEKGVFTDAAEH
ncbi:2-phosphosulfolactate phosphatase [Phytomonospora sp. NPDC050363]|uniref:2-phosphosulfolactate phosphatase n=1 Tax=Phytomonospora sp. NPDC050363 TaxID=3155642 RepID=UPI0033CADF32